jgi:peptide chain release factor subunit 1
MDKETGQEMEIIEQMPFLEWIAEKYRDFGATLEFVSDRSSEGNQFVLGFGGIGAILRYKLNFEQLADDDDEDEFYDGMSHSRSCQGQLRTMTLLIPFADTLLTD